MKYLRTSSTPILRSTSMACDTTRNASRGRANSQRVMAMNPSGFRWSKYSRKASTV